MILKNKLIYLIVLVFFIAKLFTLSFYKTIWWDASVYIGMGKYIYSLGSAGLWEPSRPLIWPLALGFFSKFGILVGKILDIVFGSLAIFLAYLIGKEIFNEKTGLLAAFFLAISPTFFIFNGIMLTETISTFFSLLAVYFLLKNRHFLSGIFFGVAFMARFLQLFVFLAILFALIYNKKDSKAFQGIFLGFLLAISPYLILNHILYNNALFPFFQQVFLTANSGWLNHHPISYYFIELFKENLLYLLFIAGIVLAIKKKESRLIVFPLVILLVFFNLIKQKEMRFLIMLLPYTYLLVSYALFYFISQKKIFKNAAIYLIVVLLFLSAIRISMFLQSEAGKTDKYDALQAKLEEAKGNIWISSPVIAAESNKKISRLIYHPVFWQDLDEMLLESRKADFIFIDTCDFGCRPFDEGCENNKKEMMTFFKQNFNEVYSRQGDCSQFAFKKYSRPAK